jgi:hypothetical protein
VCKEASVYTADAGSVMVSASSHGLLYEFFALWTV